MGKNQSVVQAFSSRMQKLIQSEVNTPVFDSQEDQDVYFGFPWNEIYGILEKGRADFRKSFNHPQYGNLTPAQQVDMYCFSNMKRHLFAATANFRAHKSTIHRLFKFGTRPVVIDVGCGPATAALALSEVFPGRSWNYYGIERAAAMRNKSKHLFKKAVNAGLLGANSRIVVKAAWSDLPESFGKNSRVLVNFSYFFGSPFLSDLELGELAGQVSGLSNHQNTERLFISYANSTKPIANKKYNAFLTCLGMDVDACEQPTSVSLQFRTSKSGNPKPLCFLAEVYELEFE